MIARLDIGERDAALRAEIEPPVGQARHAVGEAIALRGGEVERAEVERQDVGAVAEGDALEEPIRLRSRRGRRWERMASAAATDPGASASRPPSGGTQTRAFASTASA